MPPSSVVRLEPRKGSFREALMVVPNMVGPPLSLKKKISVFSSRFAARSVSSTSPTASSIAVSIAA